MLDTKDEWYVDKLMFNYQLVWCTGFIHFFFFHSIDSNWLISFSKLCETFLFMNGNVFKSTFKLCTCTTHYKYNFNTGIVIVSNECKNVTLFNVTFNNLQIKSYTIKIQEEKLRTVFFNVIMVTCLTYWCFVD